MEGLAYHTIDKRPWGNFEQFTHNEQTTVKIITVDALAKLSLQTHDRRGEFWRIISGSGIATVGQEQHNAKTGDSFFIPTHAQHRMEAGPEGVVFMEIAFGEFDENDIIRIEDAYGRS